MKKFFWIGMLLLLNSLAFAQGSDLKGSKDHPLISRYAESVIIGYEIKEFDEFILALGKQARDSNNKVALSKSQTLEGKITRIMYVSPKGLSTLAVFRNYQSALKKGGFEFLFSCEKGKCGSLFQYVPTLENELVEYTVTGHSKDQRYFAAKKSRPEGDVYVSLYIIEHESPHNRFQGHALVQLDVIEVEPLKEGMVTVNADALAKDISMKGHTAIYGIYFDTNKSDIKPQSEPTLAEIAKLLKNNPNLKLYVVGHTDNVGALDYNMNLSRHRSAAVVKALVSRYNIGAKRLKSMGIGFLAPVATNKTKEGRAKNRRVELVEY